MNMSTGTFTAPVSGVYTFHFSALRDGSPNEVWIYLQVNGTSVACSYASNQDLQVAVSPISASLKLTANDKVTLLRQGTGLFDDGPNGKYLTHFTGWLVEEDLMPA